MKAGAEERVAALEDRVGRELGATGDPPPEEAGRLAALEREVLTAVAELQALGTDLATDRGHPVLGACAAWREAARAGGAAAAAAEADALAARLAQGHAAAWRAGLRVDRADPEACFRALGDARELDLEALLRTPSAPPLAGARPELRSALLEAIEASPPGEEMRDRWTRELLDRAATALVTLDDLDPARAFQLLDVVTADLEWHASRVERARSRRRSRLLGRLRRLRAERQERDLQARLETRFGTARVALFERTILWLIVLVLGLLAVETFFDVSPRTVFWFAVLDTCACFVFLWEVTVKLWMVRGKWFWFYRHFFVDIFPSIPFSLILLHPTHWDAVRLGRAVRFARLGRFARYARILRPLMRLVRAFGFLARGIDRLVRKFGFVLNRNIVLYPTREERRSMEETHRGVGPRVRQLQADLGERWEQLLAAVAPEAREDVARVRIAAWEQLRAEGVLDRGPPPLPAAGRRDLPADEALRRLAELTPEEIEADLGPDFATRLGRGLRVLATPPLRWFPVVRRYIPRIGKEMDDAEVVAAAAHRTADELKRHHGRWLWFADLYGVVTPAQFVDRVGSAMVKGSFRPAWRLALFGGVMLLLDLLVPEAKLGFVGGIYRALKAIVSDFLLVLGSICFGVLGIGWWLRRVAGQATDFFDKSAKAQFLALTESIKGRHLERDAAILDERVLAPERLAAGNGADGAAARAAFVEGVKRWLVRAQPGAADAPGGFDPEERATLLYRDGLDGALLADSDTRTTSQLLGNPALRNLRNFSARITRADDKQLQRLDLDSQKAFFGPYFWFSLACQSVAHGAARLIVDYNRHALPLAQREAASKEERERFATWIEAAQVADVPSEKVTYVTTHFTALHFLDDDPLRDRNVEHAFGGEVLERLRRDRRLLFRRIFGMYPLHKRRREERTVNPYRIYQRWFSGGRAIFVPFRAAWLALRFARRFLGWLRRCIADVRRPGFEVDREAAEGADYHAALRKIRRMRGPIAEAVLRLRGRFDPEYLGLRLPGTDASGLENHGLEDDLAFLQADPAFEREMGRERHRTERDMKRFAELLRGGLLDRVAARAGAPPGSMGRLHLRAAASAYTGDLRHVRSLLSARQILREVLERAGRRDPLPAALLPHLRLRGLFRRYWKAHGEGDREARRRAWRAVVHDVDGAAGALAAWGGLGDGAGAEGERVLADILRHPARVTEKLVTLRCIQVLSLIDVLNYREHVYRLGGYAASGDRPAAGL